MSAHYVVAIDRLVLEGVAGSDRGVVELALRRELERLVSERGLPDGLADSADLPLLEAEVVLGGHERAAAIGASAAHALYGALSR